MIRVVWSFSLVMVPFSSSFFEVGVGGLILKRYGTMRSGDRQCEGLEFGWSETGRKLTGISRNEPFRSNPPPPFVPPLFPFLFPLLSPPLPSFLPFTLPLPLPSLLSLLLSCQCVLSRRSPPLLNRNGGNLSESIHFDHFLLAFIYFRACLYLRAFLQSSFNFAIIFARSVYHRSHLLIQEKIAHY